MTSTHPVNAVAKGAVRSALRISSGYETVGWIQPPRRTPPVIRRPRKIGNEKSASIPKSKAGESEDRRRFFERENRSLPDGVEPQTTSALCDSRTQYGCFPDAGTRTRAVPEPDQIDPFHAACKSRVSRMTSAPSRDCADSARFASRTIATASFRFARASSSVSPEYLRRAVPRRNLCIPRVLS